MRVRGNVTQALWYAGGGDGLSFYTRSLPLMYVADRSDQARDGCFQATRIFVAQWSRMACVVQLLAVDVLVHSHQTRAMLNDLDCCVSG